MSDDVATTMRAAAQAYIDDNILHGTTECVCNELLAKELQYWADKLDPPDEYEGFETLYSLPGVLYKIPKMNYAAQKSGYEYAVIIQDKKMMRWFEDGNTGWIRVEE